MSNLITIYSRHGCHLCEAAETTLTELKDELSFEMEVKYIDGITELEKIYGHEVPVIHTSSMSEVELLRTALPRRIGIQPYVALLTNSYSDFRCRSSARGDVDQEARSAVGRRGSQARSYSDAASASCRACHQRS